MEHMSADKIRKIRVDRDLCISAAACVAMAGEVFGLDSENIAVIKKNDGAATSDTVRVNELDASGVDREKILEAAQACPTLAIILEDEEGNRIFP